MGWLVLAAKRRWKRIVRATPQLNWVELNGRVESERDGTIGVLRGFVPCLALPCLWDGYYTYTYTLGRRRRCRRRTVVAPTWTIGLAFIHNTTRREVTTSQRDETRTTPVINVLADKQRNGNGVGINDGSWEATRRQGELAELGARAKGVSHRSITVQGNKQSNEKKKKKMGQWVALEKWQT